MFTQLGKNTKTTFLIVQNEKPALEFEAAATVYAGQPVKLTADGKVTPWLKADADSLRIGYVYTPKQESAANGELVTVVTRGCMLIYAMAGGDIDAGPVTVRDYEATELDDAGNTGYNVFEAPGANTPCGWMLDNPAAEFDVVRVLLMG